MSTTDKPTNDTRQNQVPASAEPSCCETCERALETAFAHGEGCLPQIVAENVRLTEKIAYLLSHFETPDGLITFPDGEKWACGRAAQLVPSTISLGQMHEHIHSTLPNYRLEDLEDEPTGFQQ